MRPGRVLRRLRHTRPDEWPFRVREQLRLLRDRQRGERSPDEPLAPSLLRSVAPAWPFPLERPRLGQRAAAELERSVEAILGGEIELLGTRFPSASAWDVDPPSGAMWPRDVPGVSIDVQADGRDVKLAWELHRLQHVQALAIGGRLLDRTDATEAARDLLVDWLLDQRPYLGVAWASGLEVASRVVSLLVIRACLARDEGLDAALWHSLTAHARFLERYPSAHSSANNHRIGELASLVVLGSLAPVHPDASTWLGAKHELQQRILQILHEDGVPAEQSPTHGAYVLEWVLLARFALQTRGLSLGWAVEERLRAAGVFLARLVGPSGHWPRIGDDDEGCVLRGGLARTSTPVSVGAALAVSLGCPELVPATAEPDVLAWSLGLDLPAPSVQPSGRVDHDHGGYAVWLRRDGRSSSHVVFDYGPLGLAPLAGHGHADALSVWWQLDGHPVLVDVGVYRYNGTPAWRRWARSTQAHNTVVVDGRDQSEADGPFTWARQADARRVPSARGVRALHDGYRPLGVVHDRLVDVPDAHTLVVEDQLHCDGDHLVFVMWHLAPGIEVERAGPERLVLRMPQGPVVELVLPPGSTARVRTGTGEGGPGSISPAYNETRATTCVIVDPGTQRQWTTRFRRLP